MSDLDDLHELLSQMTDDQPGALTFTLHVAFLAKDEKQALFRAEQYVQALNILRTEVDCYQAWVSQDNWSDAATVYCLAPGPDPTDVCLKRANHQGHHAGPGHTDSWTDDQVPAAPDTVAGLDSDGPDERGSGTTT